MSQWFGSRIRHDFGTEPLRFDPELATSVVDRLSYLYGPGRYFDLSIRGLEHVPDRPVMLVCNHSGGTTTPDVWGMGISWYRKFGYARPLHILCHELLFALPVFARLFERVGALRASLEVARKIIALGRDVLIYPGGDVDVWRPYSERYQIDFRGRTGFARVALEAGLPVVPIAHAGSHETLCVLTSGRSFARAVGLRRIARAEIWPIHLSLPWGLALGPVPHIPLPARFRYLVGAPIVPGPDTTPQQLSDEAEAAVQRQLNVLEADEAAPR